MTTPGGQLSTGDESNPPVYGVPEGAYVGDVSASNAITDLNNLTESEAKARMKAQIAPSFEGQRDGVWQEGGLLGHIADFLFGSGAGVPAARLSDGMTALNGRLDLLDDVPGFAGGVMLQNHRFTGSGLRTIRFNKEYGPAKNAYLDTNDHRMYLSAGSWSCHFTVATASGVGLGGVGHRVRAIVRDENGTAQIEREFTYQQPGVASWEQHYALPIIAPVNGWSVELRYTHSAEWWTVLGGTGKTLIWVERKNMDTLNWQPFDATTGPDVS